MVLTLNNTNTLTANEVIVNGTKLSDLYATISYVNSNSGGVSQTDFDTEVATLQSKDLAYNNTLNSHIASLEGHELTISSTLTGVGVLNGKQIQNFDGINAINTDLTNNYQTTTQLNANFVSPTTLTTNHYTKSQIDTTLGNYYTSAQIDTTLGNYYTSAQIDTTLGNYYTSTVIDSGFYTQTYINNNIYTKTETDNLIDNLAVYSQTEVDAFLSYKEDKSRFQDNISFFPIIDCSRPTIIHQGLTLKNETINIEPLEGALFGNLFGAETDRNVATFKNQSNYITLKGNKINCNATSDDAVSNLKLNMAGNIEFSNAILPTIGADLYRPSGNSSYNLRIRDFQAMWEFRNRTLTCRNGSNENLEALMEIQSFGAGQVRLGTASTARVGVGANPNINYFLNVGGVSNFNNVRTGGDLTVIGNVNLTSSTGGIQVPVSGMDIFRNSGDANYNLRIRDTQGVWEFRNRNLRCMNPSNPAVGTEMILHDTGGDYRLRIGSTSDAEVGIGRQYNSSYFLTVGGISNFNEARVENGLELLGEQLINTNARIFQRADAFNSLNVVTTAQINFSLQTDRTTDPTTGTIALQLDDTNGITINRAVTNNLTFNSIGNITAEANLNVWGNILFQHSSAINEVLNGTDYDLLIWNGDTDRSIIFRVGAVGTTPELQIDDGKVNLLGNLEITHADVSGSQRVLINNPDTDGLIRLSNNNLSRLDATNTGVDVYGDLSYTGSLIPSSDKGLKKDIKEVNSKKAVELVKYIKPKTYHFIDDRQQGKSCVGFIANDFMEKKKMPDEWQNLVKEGTDGYLKFDYTITTPILWSALQVTINEVEKLKKEVNKLKGKGKGESD